MNTIFQIKSADGLQLSGQAWIPDTPPKAVVCLIHGLGEHSGRYSHLAEPFNNAGFVLIAQDLRGHGRSEGKRGHAPKYDLLMSDIDRFLEHAATIAPDVPLFLYGHSLGGNLVIHYALKRQFKNAGVIATAPLLRLANKPPFLQSLILKILNMLRISMPLPSRLDDTGLSHDTNVIRTYRNDPLTHNLITPPLAVNMIKAGEWNLEHAAEFPCPLLLIHGSSDHITSCDATAEFASKNLSGCTLKIYENLFHEPHNEPEKDQVIAYILNWLNNILIR